MTERAKDDKPDHDDKDDVVEYFGADGQDEGQEFHESGTIEPEASRAKCVHNGVISTSRAVPRMAMLRRPAGWIAGTSSNRICCISL